MSWQPVHEQVVRKPELAHAGRDGPFHVTLHRTAGVPAPCRVDVVINQWERHQVKSSGYRAGPWPGLTPSGAGILLGCAVFLAIGQSIVGVPRQPLPDLPLTGVTALLPLALALRIVQMPGAASAVCGAYLLPRATVALFQTSLDQPPLLLVPTIAFDVLLWLLHTRMPRLRPQPRAVIAGALFGALLASIEPSFRLFLGANPATWSGASVWAAVIATAVACAAIARVLNAPRRRGTAS
jgi:hypothetical protein